ncbi:MAG TPA: tetratricopeptide repeat protein, partial [Gemmatales bacterium]|nr:tetratricopeptide repeat protein [Gemmatales bacterium]
MPAGSMPSMTASQQKDPDLPPEKAAKLCLATAEELEKNGHYEQALTQYQLALQHQPKLPGVGKKIAACYATMQQFEQAVAHYQKELAAKPNDPDLLNDLGYTYYEMNDLVTAEKYLRQAIAARKDHQRAYGNLGLVLGKQQKWKESLEAFKKAGSPAMAQVHLSTMYLAAGKVEDAKRCCNIALGMDANLKPAKDLMAKLESMPVEETTIQQAEDRLIEARDSSSKRETSSQMAAADVAKAVQLQRPVRVNQPKQPLEF